MSAEQRKVRVWTIQPNRRFFWAVSLVLVVLIFLLGRNSMVVNAWSLQFLYQTLGPGQGTVAAPPADHPNAARWIVEDALMAGEFVGSDQFDVMPAANPFVQRDLGHAAWARGDGATALAYWQRIGDYNSAGMVAQQAEAAGDLETAYQAHRTAYAIDPLRAAGGLASFLARHQSKDEAIRVLVDARSLTDHDSFQVGWLTQLGTLYAQTERWTEAELAYRELALLPGRAAAGAVAQAWLLYRRGDGLDAALARMGEAVRAAPGEAMPYYETGRLLAEAKRYTDADVWYREALQREPDELRYALAFARNARMAGELNQAARRVESALTMHPDEAALWVELAEIYRQADDLTAAVGALNQAVTVSERPNAGYYRTLATLYDALGDGDAAAAARAAAARIDGTSSP